MKINQIYIYPIKSLRGVAVPRAQATRTGFEHDRRFMLLKVIRSEDGSEIESLKNMHVPHFPEMALFRTELVGYDGDHYTGCDGVVRVRFQLPSSSSTTTTATSGSSSISAGTRNQEESILEIPLKPDTRQLEELAIVMHSSATKAFNMGAPYNAWFSECFGYEVVLAYLKPGDWRRVLGSFPPGRHAAHRAGLRMDLGIVVGVLAVLGVVLMGWRGEEEGRRPQGKGGVVGALVGMLLFALAGLRRSLGKTRLEERITFADSSPYMIVSETSVASVSARLEGEEEMDVTKFRANVIVEGAEGAFEEDYWAELVVGGGDEEGVRILLTANCVRCRSLDVDYATGKMGTGESGKVLKKLMVDRRVDSGAKYNPVFGRYGFLDGREKSRTLCVGDEVVVARRTKQRAVYDWPGLA